MGVLFEILLLLSVFAVAGAGLEVWRRRKEVQRLRDEHGEAYDEIRERWRR
ncbi:MAG: hypothetical protein AAGI52_11255 [Bacteroidota bacterium]